MAPRCPIIFIWRVVGNSDLILTITKHAGQVPGNSVSVNVKYYFTFPISNQMELMQISPVNVTNSGRYAVPGDVASSIFRDFKNAKKQRLTSTIHLLRKTLRLARVASDPGPCKPHLPSLIHL